MGPILLVLAAGMGSRYGGLKQIDPVGPSGEFIIDYSVYDAVKAGFDKVVFIIRKDIEEDFKYSIGSRYENIVDVGYAFQDINDIPKGFCVPDARTKPWGTAQAVLNAENAINSNFAVINADDFYGYSGFKLLSNYLNNASDNKLADYCMTGFILKNTLSEYGTVSRGICTCSSDEKLKEVIEYTKIAKQKNAAVLLDDLGEIDKYFTGNEIVSMNMWGFTPSIFNHLKEIFIKFMQVNGKEIKSEFFIPSVVDTLIKTKKADVNVMKSLDSWFGITYKEDKKNVVKSICSLVDLGIYPNKLF